MVGRRRGNLPDTESVQDIVTSGRGTGDVDVRSCSASKDGEGEAGFTHLQGKAAEKEQLLRRLYVETNSS